MDWKMGKHFSLRANWTDWKSQGILPKYWKNDGILPKTLEKWRNFSQFLFLFSLWKCVNHDFCVCWSTQHTVFYSFYFSVLVEKANTWLRTHPRWKIVSCESVESVAKTVVDTSTSTIKVDPRAATNYNRSLRSVTQLNRDFSWFSLTGYQIVPKFTKRALCFMHSTMFPAKWNGCLREHNSGYRCKNLLSCSGLF